MEQWFSGCQPAWRDAIGTASLDPFRGYLTALAVSLPQAVRMLDAFHVVKLAQTPLDEVRRRRQQEQRGRRGQTGVPLYRDLRRGPHTHTHRPVLGTHRTRSHRRGPSGQLLQTF